MFNQKIDLWEVEASRDMTEMFQNAESFNQDISAWHVGAVTSFAGMFDGARLFDQKISNWEVEERTPQIFPGCLLEQSHSTSH